MSQGLRKIVFQLDYHMSAQFAGIAMAQRMGAYKHAGVHVQWIPPCPPGEEASAVHNGFRSQSGQALWVGSMEQNTFLPAAAAGCDVRAVASMFGSSPLCLAGLPGRGLLPRVQRGEPLRVAAHSDTVELLQRLLPGAKVSSADRKDKMSLLLDGEVDAVQAYDVMETLKLRHDAEGVAPEVIRLEGPAFPGVALGYSQVIFAPSPALADPEHRASLGDFLGATFEGWSSALRDPSAAAEAVLELQDREVDHWLSTPEFTEESIRLCGEYVKDTWRCGRLGVVDRRRWDRASAWLGFPQGNFLDDTVWSTEESFVDGHPTAHRVREEARSLAAQARSRLGRSPKLAVISAGSAALGARHQDGLARLQLFAPATSSWFSMARTGSAHGVEVTEVDLPANATTDDVLREIRSHSDADGVVLAQPLPSSIDLPQVCAAVPASKDVDGARYLLPGSEVLGTYPPATVSGVLQLLLDHQVQVDGARALVVGRSCLLGRPLAHLLSARGATVTLAHRRSHDLQGLCGQADIVVTAAGVPGLVQSSWMKPGAVVINVGTTFRNNTIVPDVKFEKKEMDKPKLMARTIGPLSIAMLLRNVAENARNLAK